MKKIPMIILLPNGDAGDPIISSADGKNSYFNFSSLLLASFSADNLCAIIITVFPSHIFFRFCCIILSDS